MLTIALTTTMFLITITTTNALTYQPMVGDFRIAKIDQIGEINDTKEITITITCIEGEGSGQIRFTTDPETIPLSINPPTNGFSLTNGESTTLNFELKNLGATENKPFTITAKITNSLGTTTDNKTATGTLLDQTTITENPIETNNNTEQETDNNQTIIIAATGVIIALIAGIVIGSHKKRT
jgi:hypothetical protein